MWSLLAPKCSLVEEARRSAESLGVLPSKGFREIQRTYIGDVRLS